MCKFMGKREHLGSLGICAINKNKGGKFVCKGKAPEFRGIQLSLVIVQDHAATHYHYSMHVSYVYEATKRFSPGRHCPTFFNTETDGRTHCSGSLYYTVGNFGRPNKGHLNLMIRPKVRTIPILPLLTEINSIKQISAWPFNKFILNRAIVRDWNLLYRWLGEKEKTNWCTGIFCKGFQLFEGWVYLIVPPLFKVGKSAFEHAGCNPNPPTSPINEFWF